MSDLPGLADQESYRSWFVAALDRVSKAILRLNSRHTRPGVHPGYKWGHGTKVLSLSIRDLVLYSRYFTDEEVQRVAPWLYCPVDGIVIERLRRASLDPGVTLIRELDQSAFWRIQNALSDAAEEVGTPRLWFDDVWTATH